VGTCPHRFKYTYFDIRDCIQLHCWNSISTSPLPRTNHYGTTWQPDSLCHHGKTKQSNQHCQLGISPSPVRNQTAPPPPLPESQEPTFYIVCTFHIIIPFNSAATVIILNANFIDVHEIASTKTKNLHFKIFIAFLTRCHSTKVNITK